MYTDLTSYNMILCGRRTCRCNVTDFLRHDDPLGLASLSMKLGIAIATEDALPSAFVVFRDDLCRSIDRSAQLGFHGVELALRDASQVDVEQVDKHLRKTGLEIPCISSGQVFAADHLYFTHPDPQVRNAAVEKIISFIRLAAHF